MFAPSPIAACTRCSCLAVFPSLLLHTFTCPSLPGCLQVQLHKNPGRRVCLASFQNYHARTRSIQQYMFFLAVYSLRPSLPACLQVQHGTGNATIISQPMPYCGGEAYLVNEVLLPCGDVSAVMGEVANIPSPCKSNVDWALQKNSLTNYNALLLATGVQQAIYSSGTLGDFTLQLVICHWTLCCIYLYAIGHYV